ncbi:MAG: recombinase RecT [Lachnospiraceae bacterium]|nr:recombinase RecT [Lachnospiraceae bacterium]
MAQNTAIAAQQPQKPQTVTQVMGILASENVKKRFEEVLGDKAGQFMASIVNVVSGSPKLKECSPNSIIGAAFVASTYDLPIDGNLGFSAIVPYNNSTWNPQTRQKESHMEAQWQIQYKGLIQLAIRSGYYEKMNYSVVYEDEVKSYNPITGEVEFVEDFSGCKDRNSGDEKKVAGYYAWFKLKTGFSHDLFMTRQAVDNHARKYSSSYRSDLKYNSSKSLWSTNFEVMALKTVIKLLLSKWGILSVDMQRAIQDDQKTFNEKGEEAYGDNQPDVIEVQDPFAARGIEGEAEGNAPVPELQQESPEEIGGLLFEEL